MNTDVATPATILSTIVLSKFLIGCGTTVIFVWLNPSVPSRLRPQANTLPKGHDGYTMTGGHLGTCTFVI